VHEEVELREEQVTIGRRPVEERLSEADLEGSDILQERVIEVSQLREEAVINKEAVVREELVVNKTVERRTEQVEGTVRRTEVEVEDLPGSEAGDRSAFGGFEGGGGDRNG
jgi:stress response protein YsnF